MSDEDYDKHEKQLESIKYLKRREFFLSTLTKLNGQDASNLNGVTFHKMNPIALAHDFLESDFRDKIVDMEDFIYNGSLGSLKVSI